MKHRQQVVMKTLAFLLCVVLTACAAGKSDGEAQNGENSVDQLPYDTGLVYEGVTGQLTLDITEGNRKLMLKAMEVFERMYPNVEIVTNQYLTDEEVEAYYTQLPVDLMSGNTADLIVFRSHYFTDLYKTMTSGAFEDLEPYFRQDDSIHLENYQNEVLKGGMLGEARYFVPVDYTISAFLTTRETLVKNGFSLESTENYTDFAAELHRYMIVTMNDTDQYLTELLIPEIYMPWCNISLLDYETKTVDVEADGFRPLMELLRDAHDYIAARPDFPYMADKKSLIEEGKLLFHNNSTIHPSGFIRNTLNLLENGTPVFFSMPTVSGMSAARFCVAAAIPASGENKELAYAFLKVMLSEEVQGFRSLDISLPVNNDARVDRIEYWIDQHVEWIKKDSGIDLGDKITPELRQAFLDMYNNVSYAVNDSNALVSFINEAMGPYFEGQKDYDSCAAELKNKLELYIRE